MRKFEYKAIPAPTQGAKARGVKSTDERFALAFSNSLNELAADGWEYVRAETLPCTERKGLTGTQQTYQNILIFRRLQATPLPLAERPQLQAVPQDPAENPRVTSRPPEAGLTPPLRASHDD